MPPLADLLPRKPMPTSAEMHVSSTMAKSTGRPTERVGAKGVVIMEVAAMMAVAMMTAAAMMAEAAAMTAAMTTTMIVPVIASGALMTTKVAQTTAAIA